MVVAATRTLAAFQSRNDQKLGTKLSMEEIRMKAAECQGQANPDSKYHAKKKKKKNDPAWEWPPQVSKLLMVFSDSSLCDIRASETISS